MIKEEVSTLKQQHIFVPFIAIAESWLKPYILDSQLHIENYTVFRADRRLSRNGGAILYVHNNISIDRSSSFDDDKCCAVACASKNKKCIIAIVYRPPNSGDNSFHDVMKFLDKFINDNCGHQYSTFIFGDFNFPEISWDNLNVSFPSNLSPNLIVFKSFIDRFFLSQYVHSHTRNNNILDLFLTDNPNFTSFVKTEQITYSDHNLIKIHTTFFSHVTCTAPTAKKLLFDFSRFNLNAANWDLINYEFTRLNWNELVSCPLEDFPIVFKDAVFNTLSKHCKTYVSNSKRKNYDKRIIKITRKIYKLKNKIKYSDCTKVKRCKILMKINNLQLSKKEIFFENLLPNENKAIDKIKKDTKYFFKFVNKNKKLASDSPIMLIDEDEIVETDKQKISNLLQDQFKSVFSCPLTKSQLNNYKVNSEPLNLFLSSLDITQAHIISAINEIKENSGCPKEDIPAKVFKRCKFTLSLPLTLFWRKSFECGCIPSYYKTQMIIPVHKKGAKTDVRHFRPICLTPHEVKIMERVLRKEMVKFLEVNSLINNNQHGFRPNRSCSTQLISQLNYVLTNSVQGFDIDSIYIDYSKAFDKVDHGLLLKKLNHYGIRGNFFNWIQDFLKNRTQKVFSNNCFSYPTHVVSGVPQGSVLSTILFIIYTNDLSSIVDPNSVTLTFADYTKVLSKIASLSDKTQLQQNLNNIINYSKSNNMDLNKEKFELLCYNLQPKNPNQLLMKELPFQTDLTIYSAEDIMIEPTPLVRDLGININEKLDWTNHYNIIVNKAKRMSGWIFSSFYSRDKNVMLILFKSLVRSGLEYGCEIWFPYLKKDILGLEQVQRSFTNRISGLQNINYWMRLKVLKIHSLQRRREKIIILHVWKVKNNIYPNSFSLNFKLNNRTDSLRAVLPPLPKVRGKLLTKFEESFLVQACKLWNILPPNLTKTNVLNLFKSGLKKFLEGVPDEPPLPGYPSINSNSLLEQCLRPKS